MESMLLYNFLLLVGFCCFIIITSASAYIFWWKPKRLEEHFRKQGIKGNSYKLFHDDKKETVKSTTQAWSKPMSLNHHIAPRVNPFFYQMVQKHGKVSLSWSGRRARIIVADAELLKEVMNDKQGHFVKPPQNPLADLLHIGVSTLEGHQWAKRRKLIAPAFHMDKLKGMVPAFSASCCELMDRWNKLIGDEASMELDVAAEFGKLAGDVIARTAFGSSYQEGAAIFQLQKEQAQLVIEAHYGLYFPGCHIFLLVSFLPTKKNRRRYKIDKEIKDTLRNMINIREEAIRKGESSNNDLIGLLLTSKEESGNRMTVEDVIEECKLFYFAGQETTANWLTWTFIVLSMHPTWQEKARQEVLTICGNKLPSIEDLNHLKIVSLILHEVLRLYSPVTGLRRHTLKNTEVGGISVPAGVDFILLTLIAQHDTKYWGEDAQEMKPERLEQGVPKALYPFGWGPRYCLGQNFATIEAKMALAMVLQNFRFELSPLYAHAPSTVITLQPQHGAPLLLHKL